MAVRREIEIATTKGLMKIDAWAVSREAVFVVHEPVDKFFDDPQWIVTHEPTGHCISKARSFNRRALALSFAEAFEEACPAARDVKRDPDDIAKLIGPWDEFRKQGRKFLATLT